MLRSAEPLLRQRDYGGAACLYRNAIAVNPWQIDAYFGLAYSLDLAGKSEAAEQVYRLVVAIEPQHVRALYNLASVVFVSNQFAEAEALLRKVARICPRFADAYFNLALCLERLNQIYEARSCWLTFLELEPNSKAAVTATEHFQLLSGVMATPVACDVRPTMTNGPLLRLASY